MSKLYNYFRIFVDESIEQIKNVAKDVGNKKFAENQYDFICTNIIGFYELKKKNYPESNLVLDSLLRTLYSEKEIEDINKNLDIYIDGLKKKGKKYNEERNKFIKDRINKSFDQNISEFRKASIEIKKRVDDILNDDIGKHIVCNDLRVFNFFDRMPKALNSMSNFEVIPTDFVEKAQEFTKKFLEELPDDTNPRVKIGPKAIKNTKRLVNNKLSKLAIRVVLKAVANAKLSLKKLFNAVDLLPNAFEYDEKIEYKTELTKEDKNIRVKHEKEIKALKEKKEDDLKEIKIRHKNEMDKFNNDYASKLSELIFRVKDAKKETKHIHNKSLEDFKAKQKLERKKLKEKQKKEIKELKIHHMTDDTILKEKQLEESKEGFVSAISKIVETWKTNKNSLSNVLATIGIGKNLFAALVSGGTSDFENVASDSIMDYLTKEKHIAHLRKFVLVMKESLDIVAPGSVEEQRCIKLLENFQNLDRTFHNVKIDFNKNHMDIVDVTENLKKIKDKIGKIKRQKQNINKEFEEALKKGEIDIQTKVEKKIGIQQRDLKKIDENFQKSLGVEIKSFDKHKKALEARITKISEKHKNEIENLEKEKKNNLSKISEISKKAKGKQAQSVAKELKNLEKIFSNNVKNIMKVKKATEKRLDNCDNDIKKYEEKITTLNKIDKKSEVNLKELEKCENLLKETNARRNKYIHIGKDKMDHLIEIEVQLSAKMAIQNAILKSDETAINNLYTEKLQDLDAKYDYIKQSILEELTLLETNKDTTLKQLNEEHMQDIKKVAEIQEQQIIQYKENLEKEYLAKIDKHKQEQEQKINRLKIPDELLKKEQELHEQLNALNHKNKEIIEKYIKIRDKCFKDGKDFSNAILKMDSKNNYLLKNLQDRIAGTVGNYKKLNRIRNILRAVEKGLKAVFRKSKKDKEAQGLELSEEELAKIKKKEDLVNKAGEKIVRDVTKFFLNDENIDRLKLFNLALKNHKLRQDNNAGLIIQESEVKKIMLGNKPNYGIKLRITKLFTNLANAFRKINKPKQNIREIKKDEKVDTLVMSKDALEKPKRTYITQLTSHKGKKPSASRNSKIKPK